MCEPRPATASNPVKDRATTKLIVGLVAAVFFTYTGQFLLNAAVAPLARSLGLREWHIGLMLSLAALMVALLSQRWGRASQSWGRKPVLVTALALAFTAGSLFAATTYLRVNGFISVSVTAAGIIIARGAFFGAAVAAVPPTGQALIAELTPDEHSRVKALAAFGGAFNVAAIFGALASAFLASWWLLAPVYATPIMIAIALIIAVTMIPRATSLKPIANPAKLSFLDPRILPFLTAGLGMFFAVGVIHITLGFMMQDRFELDAEHAVTLTGVAMGMQAVGALLSQLILVPRLAWPPRRLLRVGLLIVAAGVSLFLTPIPAWGLVTAVGIMGVGSGLANPGFNAGASLAVQTHEQGAVAGLTSATGGLTWIFAPLISTVVYGFSPRLTIILAVAAVVGSTVVAFTHPTLRTQRSYRKRPRQPR